MGFYRYKENQKKLIFHVQKIYQAPSLWHKSLVNGFRKEKIRKF